MAISALAVVLAVPLWAQRGGGHGGGGHAGFSGGRGGGFVGHGGFGGGRSGFGGGHMGGGHFSGGMRSGRGFVRGPSFAHRGFSNRPFMHGGFHGRHTHNHVFINNCFGFGCRRRFFYPWVYGGYYDPWWWNSGSSYDEDYERDRALANEMNAQSLEEQRMRHQEEDRDSQDRDSDEQGRNVRASSGPSEPQNSPALPDTVLVFRDQHKQEVRNYAIVGQTLWNFAPQRTEKIPLTSLDLSATAKANEERGVSFQIPGTGEAQ